MNVDTANTSTIYDAAVVGGGLTGTAVALALVREGLNVCMVEPRPHFGQDRWGLNLWPSAWRTLRWLEVLEALEGKYKPLRSLVFEDTRGRSQLAIDVDDLGPIGSFISLAPSALHGALRGACHVETRFDERRLVALAVGARHAILTLEGPTGRQRVRARVVLGCDGSNSQLRKLSGLSSRRFRYPGQRTYSAVAGRVEHNGVVHLLGNTSAVSVSPIDDERSWFAVTTNGPRHPRALLASATKRDERFAAAQATVFSEVTLRASSVFVPRWEQDRVVLLGEAAHTFLPQLGLGGSQSLEDIPAIIDVLCRALRDDDLSATRLSEFRAGREARINRARQLSTLWAGVVAAPIGLGRGLLMRGLARHPERVREVFAQMCSGDSPGVLQQARTLFFV